MIRWNKFFLIEIELLVLVMVSVGLFAWGYAKHLERKHIQETTEIERGVKAVMDDEQFPQGDDTDAAHATTTITAETGGRIVETIPEPFPTVPADEHPVPPKSSPITQSPPLPTVKPPPSGVFPPPIPAVEPPPALPPSPTSVNSPYPWHSNITATVFWVGEPVGNGSSEDNALSCWDDDWQAHYGGYDDPFCREGYFPCGFTPLDQNFYVSVPYSDFDDSGERKASAQTVVPWAGGQDWEGKSMIKGRWVEVQHEGYTCYAQVNDCGPYEYDDWEYVFGVNGKENSPKNTLANNDGMDVSPALRDCLHFEGLNNADNKITWRFVEAASVPAGPWKERVTTNELGW